jgi:biotin carboxyl carrier protein
MRKHVLARLVFQLGRVELAAVLRRRRPADVATEAAPAITAPVAGEWIPAAGLRPGARVDVGALVGMIGADEIESKVAGSVDQVLEAGAVVAVGTPLVRLIPREAPHG